MKNVFRGAVLGLSLVGTAVPAMGHDLPSYKNDTETPKGLYAITDAYNDLQATALKEAEFWKLMNIIRETPKLKLQGPGARLSLIMNEIAERTYDRNPNAQRQLAICATQDIAKISAIVNMGRIGLKLLERNAAHHSYHLQHSTGDFKTHKKCQQVYDRFVR